MTQDDFAASFDAPIVEVIDNREQAFQLLDIDDLTEMAALIRGRKKQLAIAKLGHHH
jgi:DNA-binding MurR/RpiR family transcriptional regulator